MKPQDMRLQGVNPQGMKPAWRWFLAGAVATLSVLLLVVLFMAYQRPEMLLDWANLRYCG